jgi:hypothetical protein
MDMEIGQQYKNFKGEIHKLLTISPTALVVTAENISTGEVSKFRFYEASGEYIKNGTSNTTLGIFII